MSIYMQIANMKGSVSTQEHQGQIEVHNYHVEHYRLASQSSGSEGPRNIGVNKRTPVVLTKSVDNASSELFDAYSMAKNLPEVAFYHVVGGDNKCKQKVTFKDVQIDRYATHASANGILEEIEFSFMKQEIRTTPTDPQGKVTSANSAGFDFGKMVSI